MAHKTASVDRKSAKLEQTLKKRVVYLHGAGPRLRLAPRGAHMYTHWYTYVYKSLHTLKYKYT
eukprot:133179-Prorocentrum_minimum.AAC.1